MKKIVWTMLACIAISACGNSSNLPAVAEAGKSTVPEAKPTEQQTPKAPPPPKNLIEAIETAKPHMTDISGGNVDVGAAALAIWRAEYMKWSELQELPPGKYALVMKDSESQRGNKLCVSGNIIEIAVDKSIPGKKIFLGGLFDEVGRIYRFIAVRSTGEIVANSRAKFCGVITGQQSYPNSAGGVAHAVHLVGMFDLAENKRP
jgi:hypothetical protein